MKQNIITASMILFAATLHVAPAASIAILAITQDEALRALATCALALSCSLLGYVHGKNGTFDK